jgi:glycosyltransferase involved in cell wall biosynthesis
MTVFNREKYIATAIESVLVQNYENFELIIVDDCSTDRSVEAALKYEFDSRVKIYINEKNLGDYPNRNYAASLGRGKYIKFLDADDLMYPHALEIFVADMEAFPEAPFGLTAHPIYQWLPPLWLSPYEAYALHYLGKGLLARSPCGAIIRADAFWKFGPFSKERHVSDTKLWLTLARVGGVLLTDMNLVYWRRHGDQESARNTIKMVRQLEIQLGALDHSSCPLSKKERDSAIKLLRLGFARRVLSDVKRGRFSSTQALLKAGRFKLWDFVSAMLEFERPYEELPEDWVEKFQTGPDWEKMAFSKTGHLKNK